MALTVQSATSKDRRAAKSVTLQHRHFAFIANVIAQDLGFLGEMERKCVAETFASACQVTNPNFDWDRFLRACNVER